MLSISMPFSNLFSGWRDRNNFNIPSVKIHEIETAPEKPARAVKHLLKLNHANHSILYDQRKFHNDTPHLLSSSFLQGADAEDLNRLYEAQADVLETWTDSPGEISTYDWRDFLGHREYQRAFVDFFEDELVRFGYDWKQVVNDYLFGGKKPLFNSIFADFGHPLIHLAYAFEMNNREVAMEALGLAATCCNDIHKYIDDPSYSQAGSSYESTSLMEILDRVRTDKQLSGIFSTPGDNNIETIFQNHEADLLNHWNAWKIHDPVAQFRESQEVATALLIATRINNEEKHNFFLAQILTTSHAIRVLLPLIPGRFQINLVRQWWLMTLAIYIAQLRPELNIEKIKNFDLKWKNWKWTAHVAVKGKYSIDANFVKVIRAFREAAETWEDPDDYYLKAAVKFAGEFDGWAGFV